MAIKRIRIHSGRRRREGQPIYGTDLAELIVEHLVEPSASWDVGGRITVLLGCPRAPSASFLRKRSVVRKPSSSSSRIIPGHRRQRNSLSDDPVHRC
jgi:hypothetical protein